MATGSEWNCVLFCYVHAYLIPALFTRSMDRMEQRVKCGV